MTTRAGRPWLRCGPTGPSGEPPRPLAIVRGVRGRGRPVGAARERLIQPDPRPRQLSAGGVAACPRPRSGSGRPKDIASAWSRSASWAWLSRPAYLSRRSWATVSTWKASTAPGSGRGRPAGRSTATGEDCRLVTLRRPPLMLRTLPRRPLSGHQPARALVLTASTGQGRGATRPVLGSPVARGGSPAPLCQDQGHPPA